MYNENFSLQSKCELSGQTLQTLTLKYHIGEGSRNDSPFWL